MMPIISVPMVVEGNRGVELGRDARLEVLGALEEAGRAARVFVKAAEEAARL